MARLLSLCLLLICAAVALAQPKIERDTSQLRALDDYARKAERVAREWYPKVVALLGLPAPEATKRVRIVIDLNYDGVAAASGDTITVSARYVLRNPNDLGMIVHELAHVVQAYPKYDPVWLVEGIADHVRWFIYEPEARRPKPNPRTADARGSYGTTAAFLDWAQKKYQPELVKRLNRMLRDGTYSEGAWVTLTGKSLDDLNAEWKASLQSGLR